MPIPQPEDDRYPATVRGYRASRTYPASDANPYEVKECGHVWTCDGLGNSVCEDCGALDA